MSLKLALFFILCVVPLSGCSTTTKYESNNSRNPQGTRSLQWVNVIESKLTKIYGLPWIADNENYWRLPKAQKEKIQILNATAWDESERPSGARVRFQTNSNVIKVRVLHDDARIQLYHMAATGTSGMDLYEVVEGTEVYRGTTRPESGTKTYEHEFYEGQEEGYRNFVLYLPTYSRLKRLEIGIDSEAEFKVPSTYKNEKPIVVYGTSITQGCCASRVGNGFVPLLARLLDSNVVNFGFSGSGKGEQWMAEVISEVDASVFVIDTVANMGDVEDGQTLMERNYEKMVKTIRDRWPTTPIVLMTKPTSADTMMSWGLNRETRAGYKELHEPLYQTFEQMRKSGDRRIFIFDASKAVPRSAEHMSVDGIHLTDRGFWAIAQDLSKLLRKLL